VIKVNKRNWIRGSQLVVVLLCAGALKLHYSTANPNQLRWILAPTTVLVELISGARFQFESYAGYINSDHSFLIAASCAGVNFLLTAFLMLTLGKLWRSRSQTNSWIFIPAAGLVAYVVTLLANTVRISTSLQLRGMSLGTRLMNAEQLHRFEGIFIYFGFLLLLFILSERMTAIPAPGAENVNSLLRRSLFPLLIYYATTLGLPLANGAYREGAVFREHYISILLIPMLLILPIIAFRFFKRADVSDCRRSRSFLHRRQRTHRIGRRCPSFPVQLSSWRNYDG
jgi:exosortase K